MDNYAKDVKHLDNRPGYNEQNPDIPNFGTRQEMDMIRRNEELERQTRLRRAAEMRRRERIRQKKIQLLKQTITAWAILLFVVISIIAIIVGIFSSSGNKKGKSDDKNAASTELMTSYTEFTESSYNFTGDDSLVAFDEYTRTENAFIDYLEFPSFYHVIAQSSSYINSDTTTDFKNAVLECPQFSNGYVWSSNESMKYPLTDGYLYDTNASFISAVCDICLWQKDTYFLYETDSTSSGNKDFSSGMTVLEKVEAAADYFFDKNDLNGGGLRYNDEDSLVYVLTTANNGLTGAKPSNIFHNHSFGYLDLYNNILFNNAMTKLEKLYTKLGDTEKSMFYKNIASKNKKAITEKFYNKSLGRYTGYIDADGKVHDLGFTALNLMAISNGIPEKKQSENILSWIDGSKKINSDTSSEGKIYKDKKLPIFNTVCALEEGWFDYSSTEPYFGSAEYGKYYQNGAESFTAAYFNISARNEAQSDKKLKTHIDKFSNALSKTPSGNAEDLFALACAYLSAKESFGIDTDGEILYVSPLLSLNSSFSARNISFGSSTYGFRFKEGQIIITSSLYTPVKIKLGGNEKDDEYKLSVVENGVIISEESVKADENGYVDVYKRFGSSSFVVLEKQNQKKK